MRARMLPGCLLAAMLLLVVAAGPSRADRRYFTYSYTPWRAPSGTLELETSLTSRSGKADGSPTGWDQRVEFEYAASNRFTLAGYLNYIQDGDSGMRFDGPSVEAIYQLAERGRIFGDPAIYLEVRDNGEETELEPKLLLGRRFGRMLVVSNLVAELEFLRGGEEIPARLAEDREAVDKILKTEFTLGFACEMGPKLSLGLEGRYLGEYPDFKARKAATLGLGPVLNYQASKLQFALTVLPQVWGTPSATGHRNLLDFEKTQVRAILGIDL